MGRTVPLLFVAWLTQPAGARADGSLGQGGSEAAGDLGLGQAMRGMQALYEGTRSFEAHFEQTYAYKSFGRTQTSSGRVKFAKPALMRWDYLRPSPKTFVVAREKIYVHDPEAKVLHVSPLPADRLSASISFLWGQGRLEEEFDVARAERPEWAGALSVLLVPKRADPRFERVYLRLDPKTFEVVESLVIDPDGSENRMVFSKVRRNFAVRAEAFALRPPPGTKVEQVK